MMQVRKTSGALTFTETERRCALLISLLSKAWKCLSDSKNISPREPSLGDKDIKKIYKII